MFSHFYQKNIIEKPKLIFVFLLIFIASFGFFSKDFRLDASSETLLIDGDPDLKYLREITERYNSKEFLVLTYTPFDEIISDSSINNLLSLKYKIQSLNWVHNVVTILDIPLLNRTSAFRSISITLSKFFIASLCIPESADRTPSSNRTLASSLVKAI